MEDVLTFLYDNRIVITVALFTLWVIYALHHTGKLKLPKWVRFPSWVGLKRAPPMALPVEQRAAEAEARSQRLQKEVERLTLTLAGKTKTEMERQIREMAEKKVTMILPEKAFLFDPDNQLTSRPIYYIGNVPCLNKTQELDRIVEKSTLAKIAPSLARSLYDWLYFGNRDTLYFYTAQLLPNGKWAITATSKPAKKTGKYVKIPKFSKQYILLTTQQLTIDQLILNKWEITHANAAIELAATFLGPLPIEAFAGHLQSTGWSPHGEER